MLTVVRRRLAAEAGITLIELLVSVLIGMVVLYAIANLAESGGRANARLTDKTETVQRTRIGMDRITRVLRTQACLRDGDPPILEGTDDSVTFYSDVQTDTDVNNAVSYTPRKVRLTFSTASGGSVVQETWTPYTATTAVRRVLLDDIERSGSTPFLRYYSFLNTTDTPASSDAKVATPLNNALELDPFPANSVKTIVKINVALQARPNSGNPDEARRTTVNGTVFTRNADLGSVDPGRKWGPRCG